MRGRGMTVAILGVVALGLSQVGVAQEISKGLNLAGLTLSYAYNDGSSATSVGLGFERLMVDRIGLASAVGFDRAGGRSSGEVSAASYLYLLPGRGGSPYASPRVSYNYGGHTKPFAYGAALGYLQVFGAEQRGGAFRLELTYWHRRRARYVESYWLYPGEPEESVAPASRTDSLTLAVGISFYFRAKPSAPTP
jgi:hypothetical protein